MQLPVMVIRADASSTIGTGHVMRCLALGEAYRARGGTVVFASVQMSAGLVQRLLKRGFNILPLRAIPGSPEDARTTVEHVQSSGAEWIVIDGYHFSAAYLKELKEAGFRVLTVDDHAPLEYYYADIILNQNLYADRCVYHTGPGAKILRGPRYALLRREFLRWREWRREINPTVTRVLVTLGGSDPYNVTEMALRALELVDGVLEIVVTVGPASRHVDAVREVANQSRHRVQIKINVEDMAPLMAWADLAIAAAGSTSLELAFMGLPSVLCVVSDNQVAVASAMEQYSLAVNLGWAFQITPDALAAAVDSLAWSLERRIYMSNAGRRLVDGLGAQRVVDVLTL